MAFIPFDSTLKLQQTKTLKIMVFTEGTILGPQRWWNFFDFKKYVPIKNCVQKIKLWEQSPAQVCYITSRKSSEEVSIVKDILCKSHFPGKGLYFRANKENYSDIVEALKPDILIEDDCRSIGGRWQMAITYVKDEIKKDIKSIVVKEFGGIDSLPDNILDLQ